MLLAGHGHPQNLSENKSYYTDVLCAHLGLVSACTKSKLRKAVWRKTLKTIQPSTLNFIFLPFEVGITSSYSRLWLKLFVTGFIFRVSSEIHVVLPDPIHAIDQAVYARRSAIWVGVKTQPEPSFQISVTCLWPPLQQWASAKLCGVGQRAPPIFGRAAIALGIGPHSSYRCRLEG